jgi:hypothetical protein
MDDNLTRLVLLPIRPTCHPGAHLSAVAPSSYLIGTSYSRRPAVLTMPVPAPLARLPPCRPPSTRPAVQASPRLGLQSAPRPASGRQQQLRRRATPAWPRPTLVCTVPWPLTPCSTTSRVLASARPHSPAAAAASLPAPPPVAATPPPASMPTCSLTDGLETALMRSKWVGMVRSILGDYLDLHLFPP